MDQGISGFLNSKEILPIIEEYGFNLVSLNGRDLLTREIDTMTEDEIELLEKELERKLSEIKKRKSEMKLIKKG